MRFKRTRIVLEDGDVVRPIFALGVSADGGLILDLSSCAPVRHYRYGVVDVPPGEGSMDAPIRQDEASWSVSFAPKLHYHRSGLITLSATERLERHGIRATPIGQIGPNHRHCFTFVARNPFAWRGTKRRKTDLVFSPSRHPPTVTVAGFIGQLENLKPESQPENPWAIAVQGEDGRIVPTILARLEMDDPRYYLWIELHPDRPFGDGAAPALILYAFDPYTAADQHSPLPMVAVWSVPEADAGGSP